MSKPRKIRWLIAHQPQDLFVRTARAFSEELNKTCAGELEVEILTYPEYREKYRAIPNLESLDRDDVEIEDALASFWQALFDSDIEMSQIQVGTVGELYSDFHALDMPFIFDDHDHVSETLEGPVGQELCYNLGKRSGVTGLAFTYSGGYRVIGSNEPILTLDELKNKRILVQHPLTLGTTIESMGGKAIAVEPNLWKKYDLIGKGQADAVETTYLRFDGKYVLKTNHSMFMTTIVISNKFWDSLTEQQQQAFRQAALAASRKEREWSVQDAETFEHNAQANGVTITEISEEDTSALKSKSQMTYVKTKYFFTPDLIKRIRQTRH
jgi:TRAP-type C4-dicarboxylate transport system substrate-binding protein